MALTRSAAEADSGALRSAVIRARSSVPTLKAAAWNGCSVGALLTSLTTPPVDPRPNSTDDGPVSTSTASRSNGSR